MSDRDGAPTDSRRTRRHHERQMLALVLLTLVIVGGGAVGLVFGWERLVGALPCLLAGAGAILGLYFLFGALERWVR